ncbi:MAG: Uma2 family endonuclease [Spirosomataceae bacterium]
MTAQPKHYYTPEEYLVIEREATEKSEYFQGEMFMMAGGTFNHNRIRENISGELFPIVKKRGCQSLSSDMRVHVPYNGLYTYPDATITCGKLEFLDGKQDTLLNPAVIIEVLSGSTASYDQGEKFELYRSIPSFREYILIDSRRVKAEVWQKNEKDQWTLILETTNLAESIPIQCVEASIPIASLYEQTVGILQENE